MRKTTLYIALLTLVLSACTSPRREAMRQRLQYVSDCNRADTLFSARWLPTVDSLVSYFDPSSRSWTERLFSLPFREGAGVGSNERMMAHYLQGRVHHDMGEAPQALECYQKAAEQADTTRDDCDLYTLYAVYGQMATLFHAQFLPSDEIQALTTEEQIAWKDRDTLSAIKAHELRARAYYLQKDTDSVMLVKRDVRKLYLQHGRPERAAQALRVPISIYIDRQQYAEAANAMYIFENESGWFDKSGKIKEGKELYYYDKGRYLLATGKQDSARYYFESSLQAGNREAGYKGLLDYYKKMKVADSIAKYAELFATANDASYQDIEQEVIHMSSTMYNYERHKRLAKQATENAIKERIYKTIAIIALTLVLITSFIAIRLLGEKEKRRYLRLAKEFDNTRMELAQTQHEAYQIENDYQQQIKDLQEMSVELQQQFDEDREASNRRIKLLQAKSDRLAEKLKSFSSVDMESAFRKTKIYKFFDERKHPKYAKKRLTDQEWNELLDEFRRYFVQYYTFIFSDNHLSTNQRRYCVLVRLGFTSADVDILMGTDTNRRYRLRKIINEKLFGSSDIKKLEEHLKHYF